MNCVCSNVKCCAIFWLERITWIISNLHVCCSSRTDACIHALSSQKLWLYQSQSSWQVLNAWFCFPDLESSLLVKTTTCSCLSSFFLSLRVIRVLTFCSGVVGKEKYHTPICKYLFYYVSLTSTSSEINCILNQWLLGECFNSCESRQSMFVFSIVNKESDTVSASAYFKSNWHMAFTICQK